jgi:hypothetical protein
MCDCSCTCCTSWSVFGEGGSLSQAIDDVLGG